MVGGYSENVFDTLKYYHNDLFKSYFHESSNLTYPRSRFVIPPIFFFYLLSPPHFIFFYLSSSTTSLISPLSSFLLHTIVLFQLNVYLGHPVFHVGTSRGLGRIVPPPPAQPVAGTSV